MKLTLIARESATNLRTRTSLPLLGAASLLPLIFGLMLFELFTVTAFEDESRAFLASGGATFVIAAPGNINGAACDALSTIPGFVASGAISPANETVTAHKLPASRVNMYHATTGFHHVITGTSNPSFGLIASSEVTEKLGPLGHPEVPYTLDTADGPLAITGSYTAPETSLGAGMGWALIQHTSSSTPYDQCWATAWPPTDAHRQLMHLSERIINQPTPTTGSDSSSDPGSGPSAASESTPRIDPPQILQLNTELGSSYTIGARFEQRPTRIFALVALGVGAAIGLLTIRLRALQLAALHHDGWRPRDVTALALLDNSFWSSLTLATALVSTSLVAAAISAPEDLPFNLGSLAVIGLSAQGGVALGTWVGSTSITEHQLFTLFKNR